jgi:tRNA-2-methylthio-N6-dimethylallyladenosine synthase
VPGLGLTTDVIAGFPSETEDDFLETLSVVRAVRFDYAYMFRFSARSGTPAATMTPRVSEEDAGRRLARLIEVQNRITRELNAALAGQELELLIEGPSPRGADLMGRTANNKVVIFRGGARPGDLVRCRVTGIRGWTPVAEAVNQ